MITITLAVKTMEGLDAEDPQMTVDILQVQSMERAVPQQVIENFDGQVVLELDAPDGFPTWRVTVSLTRFDPGTTGFFFQPGGEPNPSRTFPAARIPDQWTPQFTPLATLAPARFAALTRVIAISNAVDLKTVPGIFFDLNADYDTLAGNGKVLAKTALLNLYAVLVDEQDPIGTVPWFSYIREIVRIDQERFIAEVDSALFTSVQKIINELASTYATQGFFTEPALDLPLHIPNIPEAYNSAMNLEQIITLKKDYEQGNVQLTVSQLQVNGVTVYLLDCDLDENRNLVPHGIDILKHLVNGGTNPIYMHEYIVEDSAQQAPDGISTVDIGYNLV